MSTSHSFPTPRPHQREARSQMWQDGIAEATAYAREHGHLRVPSKFVTAKGFNFGVWVSNRRQDQKSGRLSQERKAQLDALGMVW